MIAFKRHLLDGGRAWNLMTDPEFKTELRHVEKIVRAAVHQDIACFYDQLLVRLQQADQAADAKQLYCILDRLGRRKAKQGGRVPCLCFGAQTVLEFSPFNSSSMFGLGSLQTLKPGSR
jgi:hypothetical protein